MVQPLTISADAQSPEVIATEFRLSNKLASPFRKNIKDSANYWLENYAQSGLNPTSEEAWHCELQKILLNFQLNGPREQIPVSPRLELLQELQVINSPEKKSVLKGIDKTQTQSGRIALFNLLAQEQQSWEVVKNRQQFIKLMVENPDLLRKTRAQIANIAVNESGLIESLFVANELIKEDEAYTSQISGFGNTLFFGLIINAINKKCKKSDFLQLTKKHAINASLGLFSLGCFAIAVYLFNNLVKNQNQKDLSDLTAGASYIMLGSFFLYGLKYVNINNPLYFRAAQKIAQACKSSEILHQELSLNSSTADLYQNLFPDASSDWFNFIGKSQTPTFNAENNPSLFTHHGRALNLLYSTAEVMNELGIILRFYGEIDAYSAIAEFIIEQQHAKNSSDEPVTVCFTNFIENAPSSILHAKNFWHPIIEKNLVRPSTVYLGGDELPRDMIITGPNAGGKSVNFKALLTNLVLAQTFGIACAESWSFTPFTKIIARLKGADDTANDKSKFMLEAIGMASLLKEMFMLKPNEHAFVVTDELFTGTEVGPAISLSIELCAQIAKLPNVMYVLATHYKQICELSQITNKTFVNYKVSVFKDKQNNKLIYPFSLSEGIGNTNVAFDIFLEQLRNEGVYDQVLLDIIKKAQLRQEAIELALEHIDMVTVNATPGRA